MILSELVNLIVTLIRGYFHVEPYALVGDTGNIVAVVKGIAFTITITLLGSGAVIVKLSFSDKAVDLCIEKDVPAYRRDAIVTSFLLLEIEGRIGGVN